LEPVKKVLPHDDWDYPLGMMTCVPVLLSMASARFASSAIIARSAPLSTDLMVTSTFGAMLHFIFNELRGKSPIPLISIIEATAESIRKKGFSKVGLVGTSFTMERSFYVDGLRKHGIEVMTPAQKSERDYIHHVAKEEIPMGIIHPESRRNVLAIIDD